MTVDTLSTFAAALSPLCVRLLDDDGLELLREDAEEVGALGALQAEAALVEHGAAHAHGAALAVLGEEGNKGGSRVAEGDHSYRTD